MERLFLHLFDVNGVRYEGHIDLALMPQPSKGYILHTLTVVNQASNNCGHYILIRRTRNTGHFE